MLFSQVPNKAWTAMLEDGISLAGWVAVCPLAANTSTVVRRMMHGPRGRYPLPTAEGRPGAEKATKKTQLTIKEPWRSGRGGCFDQKVAGSTPGRRKASHSRVHYGRWRHSIQAAVSTGCCVAVFLTTHEAAPQFFAGVGCVSVFHLAFHLPCVPGVLFFFA